jgi:hypothetical protein
MKADFNPPFTSIALVANLGARRVVDVPAAVGDQLGVALWHELGCGVGRRVCSPRALAARLTWPASKRPVLSLS